MRESIFFCLLSIVHSSVVDMGGDCERMYIKEKCDSIGCSGYAGHEPNDRRLSWESCNATVKNQMVEMFPSFYLRFGNWVKCSPDSYGNKIGPCCKPTDKKCQG